VAPLGTAFTPEQGKQIRRFTSQITFLFDGDAAGRKATAASRQPAKDCGLSAKVARLPDGLDPDDFVRKRGAEGLSNLLAASQGMLDYLISEVLDENFASQDAAGQAEKVQQVIELLKAEDDPNVVALAEQHADKLAGRLGVADAHTFRALRNSIRRTVLTREAVVKKTPGAAQADIERPRDERTIKIGRAILGALLDFPQLLDSDELMAYSPHMEGDIAAAVACLRAAAASVPLEGTQLRGALSRFPEHLQEFAGERLAAPKHEDIDIARVELFANLDKLRSMELTRLSSTALSEIERARQEGDYEQELLLLKEQTLRARQKRGL
jgi:DNA primase